MPLLTVFSIPAGCSPPITPPGSARGAGDAGLPNVIPVKSRPCSTGPCWVPPLIVLVALLALWHFLAAVVVREDAAAMQGALRRWAQGTPGDVELRVAGMRSGERYSLVMSGVGLPAMSRR